MFSGPSAGGLVAGPTAGAISTNPAAYIPTDGLAIVQVNELRGQLLQRHPLLTSAAPLSQSLVNGLLSDLASRPTTTQVESGFAAKHPLLTTAAPLAQNLVASLPADLAAKASNQIGRAHV